MSATFFEMRRRQAMLEAQNKDTTKGEVVDNSTTEAHNDVSYKAKENNTQDVKTKEPKTKSVKTKEPKVNSEDKVKTTKRGRKATNKDNK